MATETTDPAPASVLVESCVTTVEEAVRSEEAGAGRLELCVRLETGGLTPSIALFESTKAAVSIPVFVMIRPHDGAFVATRSQLDRMEKQLDGLLEAGADGFVLGLLQSDGTVDVAAVRRLVASASGRPITFHRAFDDCADPFDALATLMEAGVARILTSGRSTTALQGADLLADLVRMAGGGLAVMPGGGVRADHARDLVSRTGAREVHARAAAVPDLVAALRAG